MSRDYRSCKNLFHSLGIRAKMTGYSLRYIFAGNATKVWHTSLTADIRWFKNSVSHMKDGDWYVPCNSMQHAYTLQNRTYLLLGTCCISQLMYHQTSRVTFLWPAARMHHLWSWPRCRKSHTGGTTMHKWYAIWHNSMSMSCYIWTSYSIEIVASWKLTCKTGGMRPLRMHYLRSFCSIACYDSNISVRLPFWPT